MKLSCLIPYDLEKCKNEMASKQRRKRKTKRRRRSTGKTSTEKGLLHRMNAADPGPTSLSLGDVDHQVPMVDVHVHQYHVLGMATMTGTPARVFEVVVELARRHLIVENAVAVLRGEAVTEMSVFVLGQGQTGRMTMFTVGETGVGVRIVDQRVFHQNTNVDAVLARTVSRLCHQNVRG